jgi:hypothetical protein
MRVNGWILVACILKEQVTLGSTGWMAKSGVLYLKEAVFDPQRSGWMAEICGGIRGRICREWQLRTLWQDCVRHFPLDTKQLRDLGFGGENRKTCAINLAEVSSRARERHTRVDAAAAVVSGWVSFPKPRCTPSGCVGLEEEQQTSMQQQQHHPSPIRFAKQQLHGNNKPTNWEQPFRGALMAWGVLEMLQLA